METYKYDQEISRDKYKEIQIARSKLKYQYCRVSILDAIQKMNVISNNYHKNGNFDTQGSSSSLIIQISK